jgi:hypothetical protein
VAGDPLPVALALAVGDALAAFLPIDKRNDFAAFVRLRDFQRPLFGGLFVSAARPGSRHPMMLPCLVACA